MQPTEEPYHGMLVEVYTFKRTRVKNIPQFFPQFGYGHGMNECT